MEFHCKALVRAGRLRKTIDLLRFVRTASARPRAQAASLTFGERFAIYYSKAYASGHP